MTNISAADRPTMGAPTSVPLGALLLDAQNPRIPEGLRGESQADLAVILEMGFDAFAVAQSIADFGFFQAEPLLAIPAEGLDGKWTIVEGNRRLTALMGLAHKEIRSEFAEPQRWEAIAEKAGIGPDAQIPIVVHKSRGATHAQVARAHVVGKLPWRPYMQARFIAARVEEGKTLAEVADLIGVTKSKAADLYRDQAVVAQAQRVGLETGEVEKAFSVLTVAMSNTKLRDHVGAPLGSRLESGKDPIPASKTKELGELLAWVFGDEENEPKITDSRQMSMLGNVAANEVGLKALRQGQSLDEARQKVQAAGMDPRDRLVQRLTAAKNALNHATDDLSEHARDANVQALIADIEALVESLRNTVDQVENQDLEM